MKKLEGIILYLGLVGLASIFASVYSIFIKKETVNITINGIIILTVLLLINGTFYTIFKYTNNNASSINPKKNIQSALIISFALISKDSVCESGEIIPGIIGGVLLMFTLVIILYIIYTVINIVEIKINKQNKSA